MNNRVLIMTPHHLAKNKKYLDLCKESIKNQTYPHIEHWVISTEEYPQLDSATKKINYAFRALEKDPPAYFVHMSDDVILTKTAIQNFVIVQQGIKNPVIQFSVSNNENGHAYSYPLWWGDPKAPFYPRATLEYEDFIEHKEQIYNINVSQPAMLPTRWSAFHTVFMPYSVIQAVGLIDEGMDVRHNDEEYCMRALKKRIPGFYNPGAVAIHFGNKTLSENPNKAVDERACTDYFIKKHGYENVVEWQTTDLGVLQDKYYKQS